MLVRLCSENDDDEDDDDSLTHTHTERERETDRDARTHMYNPNLTRAPYTHTPGPWRSTHTLSSTKPAACWRFRTYFGRPVAVRVLVRAARRMVLAQSRQTMVW